MDARSRSRGNSLEHLAWKFVKLKLLRNSSVYGISMMRKLFLKKFRSAAFVQIAATCWWGKFQFLYQSYFGTNFPWTRFAHNWSIYKVLWPQLQTLFNISIVQNHQLLWQKKVQFCKIKVGVRYKKGETDVRVRHQRSPGSCTRDDQCLEDFFLQESLDFWEYFASLA